MIWWVCAVKTLVFPPPALAKYLQHSTRWIIYLCLNFAFFIKTYLDNLQELFPQDKLTLYFGMLEQNKTSFKRNIFSWRTLCPATLSVRLTKLSYIMLWAPIFNIFRILHRSNGCGFKTNLICLENWIDVILHNI